MALTLGLEAQEVDTVVKSVIMGDEEYLPQGLQITDTHYHKM